MDLPLANRRDLLKLILPPSKAIRVSDHVDTKGKQFFDLAKNHKIEGIVARINTVAISQELEQANG